ncbi:RNA polymerase sigma factor [Larkinella terrae]|uniref:Sigma-70 family RNA polymerase sigma factor n=1 Tax=Larkinella terrae TaxID=2025311 RepID=A0A7K0EPL0_9BACT|nr:sigma-70 family RNA polymerase sigma factor [Larkinella terrae]MRS63491.1 sigma-70 family RNA polymerase sigma factor [Larkinella terrae]
MILPPNPCSAFATDELLFAGLKNSDDRAYACLYAQTFRSFAHYVQTHQGSMEHAQDAFQQGMAEFYVAVKSGRYQLSPSARLKSVLFEFCKRKWINELQSARYRHTQPLEVYVDRSEDDPADALMAFSENVSKVNQLLRRMGENCQRVIDLFYIQGKPLVEIARIMNYTPQTARTKRYECTEQLKKLFWGTGQLN